MAKAVKPPAKAEPKAAPKKAHAKAVNKTDKPKRTDKRGTPKDKGTVQPKHGGRIGNPPFVPTEQHRRHVMILSATGNTIPMIAAKIGVNPETIKRHFRQELDEGLPYANSELGGVLYKGALAGDAKKLEMWFDRRGGPEWQKKTGLEVSGPGGQAIRHEEMSKPADFSKLPIGKRRTLEKLLLEAAAGQPDEPD